MKLLYTLFLLLWFPGSDVHIALAKTKDVFQLLKIFMESPQYLLGSVRCFLFVLKTKYFLEIIQALSGSEIIYEAVDVFEPSFVVKKYVKIGFFSMSWW